MPDYHPPNLGGLIIGIKWGHCPPPPDDLENAERDRHPSWPASACLLAAALGRPRRDLSLLRGASARVKLVGIATN